MSIALIERSALGKDGVVVDGKLGVGVIKAGAGEAVRVGILDAVITAVGNSSAKTVTLSSSSGEICGSIVTSGLSLWTQAERKNRRVGNSNLAMDRLFPF